MKRIFLPVIACFFLTACNSDYVIRSTDWRDSSRFENAIQKFEQADAKQMPPENAVLCVGSSSIRMWHTALAEDLAPLTVIGRGFGGSNTNDLLHFADRILIKYKPRAVMIYEGDNDIAQGIKPYEVRAAYEVLIDKIEDDLPDCRVEPLGRKGILICDGWRSTGRPYASILSSPSVWQNGELLSAPLAGSPQGWKANLIGGAEDYFSGLLTH